MKAFYRLFYYFSILLTGVLAGVTLVGAFAGNTAPESFKLIPFIGLGLPVLLLANLALLDDPLAVLGFPFSHCFIR